MGEPYPHLLFHSSGFVAILHSYHLPIKIIYTEPREKDPPSLSLASILGGEVGSEVWARLHTAPPSLYSLTTANWQLGSACVLHLQFAAMSLGLSH